MIGYYRIQLLHMLSFNIEILITLINRVIIILLGINKINLLLMLRKHDTIALD